MTAQELIKKLEQDMITYGNNLEVVLYDLEKDEVADVFYGDVVDKNIIDHAGQIRQRRWALVLV